MGQSKIALRMGALKAVFLAIGPFIPEAKLCETR